MEDQTKLVHRIAQALSLNNKQVANVVQLIDEGNTIPFITRYRKQATGGLDEVALRSIEQKLNEFREMETQLAKILKSLEEQGKLTPELKEELEQADSVKRLDELYAPFRSQRITRADEARERGLGPLADAIWQGKVGDDALDRVALNCVGKHPDLTDKEVVLAGTKDLLAAKMSESVAARDAVRKVIQRTGQLSTKLTKGKQDDQTFKDYAAFESSLQKLPPHRILAIDRGEKQKSLRIKMSWDEERSKIQAGAVFQLGRHAARHFLNECLDEALKRLISPAIVREIRRNLTERAQSHAIEVFGKNLRSLLMQPPLKRQRLLAIDPGYRTGCKVAVLDEDGVLIVHDLIYVTKKEALKQEGEKLAELIRTHQIDVIGIGNGTASRETEEFVSATLQEHALEAKYMVVNEAGASIYSASDVGREEFPDLDATVRGTISIGRRLQDPLSELVKIEPQHIGVGMYQHDVAEKRLQESLDVVVESCVNQVGVDLNRASAELLKYVSGLNRKAASNIVAWRTQNGRFRSREELKHVAGIGAATFTQAAGFLRIVDGDEPLDATWIHPESYQHARTVLKQFADSDDSINLSDNNSSWKKSLAAVEPDEVSKQLAIDTYTAQALIESLLKPGRDPRESLAGPVFRSGVMKFSDLNVGVRLQGTVTNVVDFGAFVDIGLKNDGLVHISKMANTFVSNPFDHVSVGDVVNAWVANLDEERQRVGLSLIPIE